MRLLVWPVATYGCETWTLKASDRKRICAFEMTSYQRMLRISWKEHRTNQSILEEIGEETRLLKDIQRRKLHFWAHGESGQPVHGGPSWLDQWQEMTRSSKKAMDRRLQRLDGIIGRRMHRMAQERELWRTMVSLSQVIDLQQWRWSSPVQYFTQQYHYASICLSVGLSQLFAIKPAFISLCVDYHAPVKWCPFNHYLCSVLWCFCNIKIGWHGGTISRASDLWPGLRLTLSATLTEISYGPLSSIFTFIFNIKIFSKLVFSACSPVEKICVICRDYRSECVERAVL